MEPYFNSIRPEPFQILGLPLLPLSLGRYQTLKRFNCAFVSEQAAIALPADLIFGILVCSLKCDDFTQILERGKLETECEKWGNKIFSTGPWRKYLPKILQRPKPFDYLSKVSLFKRYLSEGSKCPEYFEKDIGDSSGAHWSQSVEIILRGELGWTDEEIKEMPLSKALWDYHKWMENKGMISIVTESDRGLMETAEANSAILAEGGIK